MCSKLCAHAKNTKLFFVETPSNPLTEVCDISALANLAHKSNRN